MSKNTLEQVSANFENSPQKLELPENLKNEIEKTKSDFVTERLNNYFAQKSGKVKNFSRVEKNKNGEFFVEISFDLARDKTLYGLLVRGLKMSAGNWEKQDWNFIAEEIAAMNGKKDFKMRDGESVRVPVKKLLGANFATEKFQEIEKNATTEFEKQKLKLEKQKLEEQKKLERKKVSTQAETSVSLLDLDLKTKFESEQKIMADRTAQKFVVQKFPDFEPGELSREVRDEFFPKPFEPEISAPPAPKLPEKFSEFLLDSKDFPEFSKKYVYRANMTLKKMHNANGFLPDAVFFSTRENLIQLMKNPAHVKKFVADSHWELSKNQKFENLSAWQFDALCTRIRWGQTNEFLREKKFLEIKNNDYDMYSKLRPELQKITNQFAQDFHELEIDFYSEKNISFVLSGGAEKNGHSQKSHHHFGRAIDLRTGDVNDKRKLKTAYFYLRNFRAAYNSHFQKNVVELLQEDRRISNYKKTEAQRGAHFHFALEKNYDLKKSESAILYASARSKKNTENFQFLWEKYPEKMREIEKVPGGFEKFSTVFFERNNFPHELDHLIFLFFDPASKFLSQEKTLLTNLYRKNVQDQKKGTKKFEQYLYSLV
ncbi:hypothetical protein HN954_02580 [bacterium]|jgi:hypothetical protein|nr:hypothetical protein [bacterium]MBT6831644.1 hypothetical protein [bacterium]MBT6996290.1 hypothetical protein [bacterium]MBT7772968.1 hypothetical protein [bacterium]